MKKKLLCALLLIGSAVGNAAFAQEFVDTAMVKKIRNEGLNHSKVMETAFYLTDASGPRLAGSPSLKRAQDWAVNQLKTWGLVNAAREPWGKFGKGWEVQKNYAAITVPYYHAIIAIPKAWTPGTNGLIQSNVVLIKADTITDLDKYKGKIKDKVVIIDTKALPERTFKPDAVRNTDEQLDEMAKAVPAAAGQRRNGIDRNSAAFKARALRTAINSFLLTEAVP